MAVYLLDQLPSASVIAVVLLLIVVLYLFHDPHPELRHLPWASPFIRTGLWLRWQELRGGEVTTVHDLHRKLGPVIRLSRDAVSVAADSAELRKIHTRSQCAQKSAQYEDLLITFHCPVFGIVNSHEHAKRRAGYGNAYSRALDFCQAVDGLSRDLASMDGQVVDAIDIFWSSIVESNQELLFGASQQWPPASSYEQVRDRRRGETIGHGSPVEKLRLIGLFPQWLRRRLRSRVKRTLAAEMVEGGVHAAEKSGSGNTPCNNVKQHFEAEIAGAKRPLSTDQEKLIHQRVCDELIDQSTGAVDFPLSVLTNAISLLARSEHQHWQDQTREPNEDKVTAVVNEILRLYPPAAGSQPRELLQTVVLPYENDGITLHPGVVVHAQPFTLHRSGQAFSHPETFLPQRWLGDRDAKASSLWAFGKGPTHCIAQEYAMKTVKRMLKVACTKAQFFSDAVLPDLMQSQSLLLTPPEVKVRVQLRS